MKDLGTVFNAKRQKNGADDRYKYLILVDDGFSNEYTVIEADKTKGYRITTLDVSGKAFEKKFKTKSEISKYYQLHVLGEIAKANLYAEEENPFT